MKERIRRFELYSFFDPRGIEERLRRMAAKGWLLEKLGSYGWIYRRIEPKKLTFCVTYYPGASVFDPEPSEGQSTFYDFCEHTGWVLAAASAQMQVFYNERENPVPIETDPVVEIETIHQSKGNFLFSNIVLLAVALLNGGMLWGRVKNYPAETLANSSNLFSALCWLCVIALCAADVGGYYLWHRRAVRAAEQGVFLSRRSSHRFQCAMLLVVLAALAALLFHMVGLSHGRPPLKAAVIVMGLLGFFLIGASVNFARDVLKRRKVSKGVNLGVTAVLCFVLSIGLISGETAGILYVSNRERLTEGSTESYEYEGHTFTAYHDELPLTVEDLLGVEYDGYSRQMRSEESFLVGWMEAVQKPRLDAADSREMPYLSYTVVTVKVPALYGFCRDAMLRERDEVTRDVGVPVGYREQYQAIDPTTWRAEEAYRLTREDDGPQGRYLLCYEGRIVSVYFDWEVTEEEMGTVAEQLGGRS